MEGNRTNGTDEEEDDIMLPDEISTRLLWKVFPPILIIVGTLGNILTIIVLTRKSLRKSRVSAYLICLAVADMFVLWTGLLRQWLKYMFEIDIREESEFVCKMNTWFVYLSLDMSAWILVSVTVERAISITRPLQVRTICTTRTITVNLITITLMLMLVNGHFLFGRGYLSLDGEESMCFNLSPTYADFLEYYFPWIDLFFFSLGPFVFQIVCNTIIVVKLTTGVKRMAHMNVTSEQAATRQRQVSSMTRMLLCLNLMYLIFTLPVSIYLIYTIYWQQDESREASARRDLIYTCANILMYMNNSTNFITYTLSGKQFRSELFRLFRKSEITGRSSSSHSTSISITRSHGSLQASHSTSLSRSHASSPAATFTAL